MNDNSELERDWSCLILRIQLFELLPIYLFRIGHSITLCCHRLSDKHTRKCFVIRLFLFALSMGAKLFEPKTHKLLRFGQATKQTSMGVLDFENGHGMRMVIYTAVLISSAHSCLPTFFHAIMDRSRSVNVRLIRSSKPFG